MDLLPYFQDGLASSHLGFDIFYFISGSSSNFLATRFFVSAFSHKIDWLQDFFVATLNFSNPLK